MMRRRYPIIVSIILPSLLLSANLLNNPGFESWTAGKPVGWSNDHKIVLSQETDTIHGGASSVQVVCTTQTEADTDFWHTSGISVTAGQQYTFTVWVFDNDPAGRLRLYIQWIRPTPGDTNTWGGYSGNQPSWQQLSYTVTAPTGATWAKPSLRHYDVSGSWDGDALFYIDDAYFAPYPSTQSGNVIINEIMYNPAGTQGGDAHFEWIELWNRDAVTMDMSGWTVSDIEDTFHIPGGAVIPPGHFLVIPRNRDSILGETEYTNNLRDGNDYITVASGLILADGGDEVVVRNGAGVLIDSVRYSPSSPWPTSANGGGPSLELYNPTLDNTLGGNWLSATERFGTPGDTNSTFRWIADTSSNWDETTTWSPGGVPTQNFDVEIPSGRTVTIRDIGGDAYCKDLIINGTLTDNSGVDDTLFVYGDWKNNGTFNRGTGTVTFRGTGKRKIDRVTGSAGTERFHNLVIELASINDTIMAKSLTTPARYDSIRAANFTIKSGTFIQEQQENTVDNNFTLSGGRYVMSGNLGEIDVAGNVHIASQFIFEQPWAAILCAGDLSISGDNIFTSPRGQVLMDGGMDHNTISMTGSGNSINFLKIEATNTVGNLTDSVTAISDITARDIRVGWGVYSPGGHKTTVTDTVLFIGTRGTLRMRNPGDTLDLDRGLWLNRGAEHQAKTEISAGVIHCGGMFKDSTDAGFQPSGGVVIFDGTTASNIRLGPHSHFHNMVVNKSSVAVICQTDIRVNNLLTVRNGIFSLGARTLRLGDSLHVNAGGEFRALGTSTDSAHIRAISGAYRFIVDSAGVINAKHCVFSGMGIDGIYLKKGATIASFDSLRLTNGMPGEPLLRVETAGRKFRSIQFDSTNPGARHNVRTTDVGQGIVDSLYRFPDNAGTLYGEQFDSDPGETGDTDGWIIFGVPVGVDYQADIETPKITKLSRNYPNPFRERTVISYQLSGVGTGLVPVRLEIYDISGRLVRTLVDKHQKPGTYHLSWDGRDDRGRGVASGIYLLRFETEDYRKTLNLVKISR